MAMIVAMSLCRRQMADDITRAGGKQRTTGQERAAAEDGKQQDPTMAGNKRRGKGGEETLYAVKKCLL